MRASVFRSAITGTDGTIDPGYLAMFWALVIYSVASAATLVLGYMSIKGADTHDHAAILGAMGNALAVEAGGFASVLGAVGLFRMGDKQHPGTVTTIASKTVT